MWGIFELRPRAARLLVGTSVLLTLAACATHSHDTRPPAPTATSVAPRGERDATGAYRFNMTQNGRRMSADEFDAWMKARGIRVAKGAPATAKPPTRTAKAITAKTTTAKAGAKAVVAKTAAVKPAAAKPKPNTVAQAVPKAKPKPKPAAQEVSVQPGKAASKQATSEG